METIRKLFGHNIRTLRNSAGLSQEELAFKASISTNHLGQIERGLKCPTIETAAQIANALGLPLAELFEFQKEMPHKEYTIDNKISAQLSSFTPNQQEEVLKILKSLQNFANK